MGSCVLPRRLRSSRESAFILADVSPGGGRRKGGGGWKGVRGWGWMWRVETFGNGRTLAAVFTKESSWHARVRSSPAHVVPAIEPSAAQRSIAWPTCRLLRQRRKVAVVGPKGSGVVVTHRQRLQGSHIGLAGECVAGGRGVDVWERVRDDCTSRVA